VQGTSSNGINCAWVYVDDNPVGAFQLPGTFPIIATTGPHAIEIFAGVEENGTAGTRLKYPFYAAYTATSVTLTQGSVTKFKPTTEYASWTDFALMENFESDISGTTAFTTISTISASDTSMFVTKNPANVYQGTASGEVYLSGAANSTIYCGFSDTVNLANNGNAIFMELNYKSNCIFEMGVYSLFTGITYPVIDIDTSSVWRKMYINLQPTIGQISANPAVDSFRMFFYMDDVNGTPVQLYLDNIKVLRYK